jgi:hypothetical protein
MTRKTSLGFEDPVWETILRFIRVGGAGAIALVIGLLMPIGTPETVFLVAVLVAIDKYLRTIGFWDPVKTALKL